MPVWHKSVLLKTPACRNYPHGRTNWNRMQNLVPQSNLSWELGREVHAQETLSWLLRLSEWIKPYRKKTHPVGELNYVAEQTIPPLKEKSCQRCLWDSWAARRREKQSGDCPWRVRCECYVKTGVYRTLFSARWVLFSLQGGGFFNEKKMTRIVSPCQ